MTKTRSVSFMKTFYSYPEAEDYAEKLAVPSIVVFLVGTDGHNLFTVCAQEHIDAVQEELNSVVKELAAPEKIEWQDLTDEEIRECFAHVENVTISEAVTFISVVRTTQASLKEKNT